MEQDVGAISVMETWIKDLDHSINSLILDMRAVTSANVFEQTIQ